MRAIVLQQIISAINGLEVDDRAKQLFIQLVHDIGTSHGVKHIERAARITFAHGLLQNYTDRTLVMERLKSRYGVSREQAYRDIRRALELCQKSNLFATAYAQNKVIKTTELRPLVLMKTEE